MTFKEMLKEAGKRARRRCRESDEYIALMDKFLSEELKVLMEENDEATEDESIPFEAQL